MKGKNLLITALALVVMFAAVACASSAQPAADAVSVHDSDSGAVAEVVQTGLDSQSVSDYNYSAANNADSRLLIRNVSITLETATYQTTYDSIIEAISKNGAYIENSNVTGTGKKNNLHEATIVIRVPAENMDALIKALDGNGTVTSSSESVQDVTLEYIDMESRISSLKTERDSITKLLEQADDLDTILELQDKISEINYEIENYESSLLVMQNQITYSTLTLNIKEVIEETEVADSEEVRNTTLGDKMWAALKGSLNFLLILGQGILIVLSALLPVIVIIGIPVTIVLIVRHRKKKAKKEEVKRLKG